MNYTTIPFVASANGSLMSEMLDVNMAAALYDFSSIDIFGTIAPKSRVGDASVMRLINDTIRLQFQDPGTNFPFMLGILAPLFSADKTLSLVTCSFPISGAYDRLPRWLFYLACIVAILGRKQTWISDAALSIVLAFSSVSAAHLFVLLGLYRFRRLIAPLWSDSWSSWQAQEIVNTAAEYGDVDVFGIMPIIAVCVVLLPPMLSWSSTFRSHKSKIILQCWALYMFVTLIVILVYVLAGKFVAYHAVSLAFCDKISDHCRLDANDYLTDYKMYHDCNCNDFCGLLMVDPPAPLRHDTTMVAELTYKIGELASSEEGSDSFWILWGISILCWGLAIIHGARALIGTRSKPEVERNMIYHMLSNTRQTLICMFFRGNRQTQLLSRLGATGNKRNGRNRSWFQKTRHRAALLVAAIWYIFSLMGMLFYPVLFISTSITSEISLAVIPASERSSSVGAWAPWVAVAFVVLSAIIQFVHPFAERQVLRTLDWMRYQKNERPERKGDKSMLGCIKDGVVGIADHVGGQLGMIGPEIASGYKDFIDWWKDPQAFGDWYEPDEASKGLIEDIPIELKNSDRGSMPAETSP